MKPPANIREALGMGDDEKALYLLRVRSKEGQPFGYYVSWTCGVDAPLKKRDFVRATRLEIFRDQGLNISHVTQTISAVAASTELADHLDTEEGAPLISLARHSYEMHEGEEQLVDFLQVYYHPERFQYRMDLKIED